MNLKQKFLSPVVFLWQHPFVLVPFAFYIYTCAPTVLLGDPCLLIEQMKKLSINTHVNNHNIIIISGWLFQHLPIRDIAYKANLTDAMYGSAAVALFYCLNFRVFQSRLRAAICALFLMVSHSMWWNSTVSEDYGPNALFTVLWLYLLYRFNESSEDKYLRWIFFVAGLAVFNHVLMGFAFLCSLIPLFFRVRELKNQRRQLVLISCLLSFFLGFLPYLITFLKDVCVVGGFWKAVSLALFGSFRDSMLKTPVSFKVFLDMINLLWMQFPSPYILCVMGGLVLVAKKWQPRCLGALVAALAINFWAFNFLFNTWDKFCYLLPCFIILALCGSYGVNAVFNYLVAKKSLVLNAVFGMIGVGSLFWPMYFYAHIPRWGKDPQSVWYENWNNNYTINTHRVNEYLANPNKRNYYDMKEFCDLVFYKLPQGSIIYDDDSRTYDSLATYYQQFHRRRLDIRIRMVNSWGIPNWGDSSETVRDTIKKAYETDKDLFLVTLDQPFASILAPISSEYHFRKYPLDDRRWIYRLVTASEAVNRTKEIFDKWDQFDPDKGVFIDLKDFNVLYVENGTVVMHDTTPFGDFWKNSDDVFLIANNSEAEMGFLLRFTKQAVMDLKMNFMIAPDFGICDIYLNDTKQGSLNLYNKNVYFREFELRNILFEKGNNILRFRIVGKDFESENFKMGIDTIELHESRAMHPDPS